MAFRRPPVSTCVLLVAVDTLGEFVALVITSADAQDHAQIEVVAATIQEATDDTVELVYVDQSYTGTDTAEQATDWDIQLVDIKHTETTCGCVLLPRRWVVERSLAWLSRFWRLAKEYGQVQETVVGLHSGRLCHTHARTGHEAAGAGRP